MNKYKKVGKKLISLLLAIIMCLPFLMVDNVKAIDKNIYLSGDGGSMTYQLGYNGIVVNRVNVPMTKILMNHNGKQVVLFCLEPALVVKSGIHHGKNIKHGDKVTLLGSSTKNLSEQEFDLIKHIIFWGWDMSTDSSAKRYYAVQFLVWKALGWRINSLSGDLSIDYINRVEDEVKKHLTQTVSFDGRTITLKRGQSVTIEDTNRNLQYLGFPDKDGWILKTNKPVRDKLTITATANARNTTITSRNPHPKLLGMKKESLIFESGGSQKVIYTKDPDRVRFTLNLRVEDDYTPPEPPPSYNTESLKIIKEDTNGRRVSGVQFEIARDYYFTDLIKLASGRDYVTTGSDGTVTINGLLDDNDEIVYIRERSVPDYLVKSDEIKEVNFTNRDGYVHTVTFVNEIKTIPDDVKIVKEDELGNRVEGVVFEIASDRYFYDILDTVTTKRDGTVLSPNVLTDDIGTVYVREKSVPSHLVKSDKVETLTFIGSRTHTVTFINELQPKNLVIAKRDELGNRVKGVTFEVSRDRGFNDIIDTITTDEYGTAYILDVLSAHKSVVYVREKSVPSHLVKSDEIKEARFDSTDEGVIELYFINNIKPDTVNITKTDEFGNKVAGVVFEVASDENFRNILHTLTTTSKGTTSFSLTTAHRTVYIREKTVPSHLVKSTKSKL